MATCDPNDLMSRASAFVTMDRGALDAVRTQMLCEISLKIGPTAPANERVTAAGDVRVTSGGDIRVYT